jgi:lipopolysaccharide transport system permease protein
LYASPVGFSSSVVPYEWRLVYSLNPIVGIIDGFRWCILGDTSNLYLPGLCASLATICLFLWIGFSSFRATEKSFADLV